MRKVLFMFILFVFLISFVNAGIFQKQKTCGDETLEGECSTRQPYICSEEILVEKASVCGCSENMTLQGDSCVSEYMSGNSKEITLEYVLRGEKGEINYVVYEEMRNYLFDLPDFITYRDNQVPFRGDFKLRNLNEPKQRELLLPLVTKIQNLADNKKDQARIAISIVQHISFGNSNETISLGGSEINYSRYPYEVLYEQEGVCGEKSELLAFILREIDYGVVLFYHAPENHESLGIKCPEKNGLENTTYCFIETTGPSILTNNKNKYLEGIKLTSYPEIIPISDGEALGKSLYEYRDARHLIKISEILEERGKLNIFRFNKLNRLKEKYNIK